MTLRIERVVVTGGRKFTDGARIEADLRALLPLGLERVAEGGAPGADDLAYDAWHLLRNESTQRYHVKPHIDGRWPAAGPRRSVRMLEAERPALVLAYPDVNSRGTWRCVKDAVKRGITCAVWAPHARLYDLLGEEGHRGGIYVDGPKGHIMRIDTARSALRGGESVDLYDGDPRFVIAAFARRDHEQLLEVLQ